MLFKLVGTHKDKLKTHERTEITQGMSGCGEEMEVKSKRGLIKAGQCRLGGVGTIHIGKVLPCPNLITIILVSLLAEVLYRKSYYASPGIH